MSNAQRILRHLLETDETDDYKDLMQAPQWAYVNPALLKVLSDLKVTGDRLAYHYSDLYIMCPTWAEAAAIKNAGPWKSMAEITRTNPEHPDAKQWPVLLDIPFANMGGYMQGKANESQSGWHA